MKEEQEITPLRTILQNFLNHVENLDRPCDDSYDKEFQSLKLFSESLKSLKQYSCTEGEKEVNKKKNRYKDILPFDYTRVILSVIPGINGSDYVNANYIKGASGSLAYIASQGPLSHTTNDFWRMVVECEVQVIVMACNEEESGKHKCEHYWTDEEGEEKQFGMATIKLVKASVICPDFLVRTMQLRYKKDDTTIERTVCQFHYSAWPDHGVPPLVRPLLDMVRLVRDTQASETLPVLIHCSAGCGRTGTICAIDYVWGLLRAGKLTRDFSLLKLVRDMRKQRIAMVQTKDQYVLVHKAVRELFQEQLKMIDAHPYENVDLNGVPLLKEEPTYESVRDFEMDEKQDNKEKEHISHGSQLCDPLKENKFVIVDIPPLPLKKSCSHVAPSKHEKEVENQTQKQLSGISSWSTNYEVTKCEPHYNIPPPSVSYSSTGDSGLSASSTDSSSTITSEKLPKRCPLPLPLVENLASNSIDQKLVAVHQDDSSSSSSPSISSLLHKPRIAKLKALFERNSASKSSKSRNVKPFDESDFVGETPKARPSQQVTRSHSLGAVRKPNKFSQFQTASETPVALYRKLFSTKENKETNLVIKKGTQTETFKAITKEGKGISSSSSSSTSSISNVKTEASSERSSKTALEGKQHLNDTPSVLQSTSGGHFQNLYHPTPRQDKPILPIKRSKSLKVVGNVDHSYLTTTQNYILHPSQLRERKSVVKQQLCPVVGDDKMQCKPLQGNNAGGVSRGNVMELPVPKERQKKNVDTRHTDCVSPPHQAVSSKVLQPCSKLQAARLSSVPLHEDYVHLNGSVHFVTDHSKDATGHIFNNYQTTHSRPRELTVAPTNEAVPRDIALYSNARNKEYVNISELKSNWHQAGLEAPMPPSNVSNRSKETSHAHFSKPITGEGSQEKTPSSDQPKYLDQKSTTVLDESTQKIIDDCRKYLLISHDPGLLACSQDIPEDDLLQSEQYDSLSVEAQRKINTIVGGIGIRERRNSFRKAVCHEGDAANKPGRGKQSLKDYEPIWLQSETGKCHIDKTSEHWMQASRNTEVSRGQCTSQAFSSSETPPKLNSFSQNSTEPFIPSTPSVATIHINNVGKRPSEHASTSKLLNVSQNPTYHPLHMSSSWDSAGPGLPSGRPEDAMSQCQHLQQRAAAKAMSSRFPTNANKASPVNIHLETSKAEMVRTDVSVPTNCSTLYKRENSNIEIHGGSQQLGATSQCTGNSGPSAPPRIKRNAGVPNLQHRNSMFEPPVGDLLRSDTARKLDPLYANTDCIKTAKDGWHGAPGFDVDTVAASIKKSSAQNESSTPLTRAFEKLHSKASNLRTKLSPKSDVDSTLTVNQPNPDTRQQNSERHVSSKVSKSPQVPGLTPHTKKQQQYL